jgi:hypothetical protein
MLIYLHSIKQMLVDSSVARLLGKLIINHLLLRDFGPYAIKCTTMCLPLQILPEFLTGACVTYLYPDASLSSLNTQNTPHNRHMTMRLLVLHTCTQNCIQDKPAISTFWGSVTCAKLRCVIFPFQIT